MPYDPFDWTDNIDLVDEEHLNHLEQGVAAAEEKANKGAASGYAPLDGGAKVPLAFLPPIAPAGADLSYEGDWVAGTYQDGDVVVRNGIAFMCVGGPTTAPPDETVWGLSNTSLASYGVTLPASPVDGQEAILVDSLGAPTRAWRFRYSTAIADAYKWVFIGGTAAYAQTGVGVGEAIGTLSTWVDLATVGPQIVSLRAGIYDAIAEVQMSAATAALTQLDIWDAAAVGSGVAVAFTAQPSAAQYQSFPIQARITLPAAGHDIRLRYWSSAAASFFNRTLRVTPVRVA